MPPPLPAPRSPDSMAGFIPSNAPGGSDRAGGGLRGYPRPQLRRSEWLCLNGEWEFALDPPGAWTQPAQVRWEGRRIVVPFSPETERSGIGHTAFFRACWYRKAFDRAVLAPGLADGERLHLHFG